MGELKQHVNVGRFIVLHVQNGAKEHELSKDGNRQERAVASEIINFVI